VVLTRVPDLIGNCFTMPSDITPTRNILATGINPARGVISAGSSVSGRMPTATRCRDRRSGPHRAGTYSRSRARPTPGAYDPRAEPLRA